MIATYAALSGLFLPNSKLHIPGLGHASASSHKAGSLPSNHSIPHIVHMTWKNKNIRKDLGSRIWGQNMGSEGSRLAESERGVWL